MPKTVKRRKNKLAGRYRNRWPDEAEISGRMIPKWVADSCRNRWPDHPEICIRLGAQANGGVCVFSSEFDSFAQNTYSFNHGEHPFGDITKVQEKNIPDHDVLLAGFPCQPFSYSGRCEGFEDKTRGTLFFDVLRILEQKKPKFALLENVKGFKSHNKGETMFIALNALEEAGYASLDYSEQLRLWRTSIS